MENQADFADKNEVTTLGGIEELFRRLPVAVYRSAPDGSVLEANPALANLLGYDTLEQLSDDVDSVESFYVDPAQRTLWLQEIVKVDGALEFDIELRRRDGSTVWVQDTARAVFDSAGDLAYCQGAIIDISEKVKARKARDQFVATVSHELRNPMSAILVLAHELADDYDNFGDEERKEMIHTMAHQADDASWIIEDLLVAYREDTTRVAVIPERFDVGREIERVLKAVDGSVKYSPEHEETRVYADPRRTRQILRNLVSNALRYGGDDVRVTTRRGDADTIQIRVCDDGHPLDPHEAQRIFRAYERGSAPLDPISVGLGLSVARKLAGLMDGELVYEHDGEYSCFIVTLPAAT